MHTKLRDMEHIRQVYRQSGFVLMHPLLIIFAVNSAVWYFAARFNVANEYKGVWIGITIVSLLYFAEHLLLWSWSRYIVTNMRLIQILQSGLFKRSVVETPHDRVLNISYKTEGFVSAIFGYGDVEVQVVGLTEPIVLKNISDAAEIKDYLWEMHRRASEHSNEYSNDNIATLQQKVGYTNKGAKQ